MGEFANALIASLCGSLAGALGAYWVAMKSSERTSADALRLEEMKHQRLMASQLLQQIDEYLHYSFRSDETYRQERQKAARALLTTAMLCVPGKVQDMNAWLARVDAYHYKKQSGDTRGMVSFGVVQTYFQGLQKEVSIKFFNVDLSMPPSTENSGAGSK